MAEDFGFGGSSNVVETTTSAEEKTNLETGNVEVEGKTNLDNDDKGNQGGSTTTDEGNKGSSSTGGQEESVVAAGDTVEIDGINYTVNEDGALVDEKGEVFKTKEELDALLEQNNVEQVNETNSINVEDIQKLVGINVEDEKGKAIVFDNTPEGVAQYVNSIIELKRDEFAQAGINKLIQDYPIVNDFLNYYIANGNSYEGFGQLKDRSGITIDENNVTQQEAIVREAWKEFNKRGNVEKYITYLKDSGQLVDIAKEDLAALQQLDAEVREENSRAAVEAQRKYEEEVATYWNNVKSCIDKREIAGYKIPETIILNKNGKQVSATPNDFFNYVYQVDNEGMSQYQRELANESIQDRMQDELLKAWLKYTGKSYDSLLEMGVAAKEVKKLRLTANNNKAAKTSIRVTKAAKNNGNLNDENFGY